MGQVQGPPKMPLLR